MLKPSKTTLKNKADTFYSLYWRELKGKCEWCGRKETLQLCHGITRGWGSLRYEPKNTLVLCASDHRKVDQNFTFKWMLWETMKGKEAIEWLKIQKPKGSLLTKEFYQGIIKKYGQRTY